MISYGPCQFPTLGFVVERWARIETFIPENFFTIKFGMKDPGSPNREIMFQWKRNRLYDHACALALYQATMLARKARVLGTEGRNQNKWRPTPLATVELQKRAAKYLRLPSEVTMDAAEKLYQAGYISYPRTETEIFKAEFDVRGAVEVFRNNNIFGEYARGLLDNGKFQQPRNGRNDDNAHPPITPVKSVDPAEIPDPAQRSLYQLVTKHFLACCSMDAKGQQTVVSVEMGTEQFTAKGLMVKEVRLSHGWSEATATSPYRLPK